jgi:hypothetical protein
MSKFTDRLKTKSIVINNPYTGMFDDNNRVANTGNGIWSQLQSGNGNSYKSGINPIESKLIALEKKMQVYELQTTLLRLKVLGMEGKFTQEEISNIKKMIMSEDEASRTLAETIIENA